MNLLSLYSGIGGIDLGAHWAGITSVAFCEADPFCRSILSRHWPGVPIFESDELVSAAAIPQRIDIIAGGPPCQPFSVAGKQQGVIDPRHRWPQMARIIEGLRPAWVVVENVTGFSDVAERLVRADLESIGYRSVRFDVPAAGVGAPHKRERIFVVGYAASARCGRSENTGTDRGDAGEIGRGSSESLRGRAGLEVEPCPDGDCRWHVASGFDVCTTDAGLAAIRAEWVADADISHGERDERSERGAAERAESIESRRAERKRVRPSSRMGDAERTRRERLAIGRIRSEKSSARSRKGSLESRLGRVADGVADRLDAARWPAAYGSEQFDYEPARVTTEREFRRKRLKALGNAVVPLQIYPILALIHELWKTEKAS